MIPPFIRLLFQWALCYPCIVFPPLTEPDLHRIALSVISTNQQSGDKRCFGMQRTITQLQRNQNFK